MNSSDFEVEFTLFFISFSKLFFDLQQSSDKGLIFSCRVCNWKQHAFSWPTETNCFNMGNICYGGGCCKPDTNSHTHRGKPLEKQYTDPSPGGYFYIFLSDFKCQWMLWSVCSGFLTQYPRIKSSGQPPQLISIKVTNQMAIVEDYRHSDLCVQYQPCQQFLFSNATFLLE